MKKIDWVNTTFLTLTPLLTLILVPIYFWNYDMTWPIALLAVFFWKAAGLSITAGYHRLFAHRSYEAKGWLKFLYLFFGAGAFQNSALKWCSDHRIHHRKVDTDQDPYNINEGFFYAHMGWIMLKSDQEECPYPPDLLKDKLVMFQHKYYLPMSAMAGFGLPLLLGWALGDAFGGFLFAGLVRVVFVHHSTFFVNSLAHYWGSKPYSLIDTARDNAFVAFLTNGEGYHNFHHKFEADYRNGIKWYHYDPTKWWIKTMSLIGQTKSLRKVPDYKILQAKIEIQFQKLKDAGANISQLQTMKESLEETQKKIRQISLQLEKMKENAELELELQLAKIEFRARMKQWKLCISRMQSQYA